MEALDETLTRIDHEIDEAQIRIDGCKQTQNDFAKSFYGIAKSTQEIMRRFEGDSPMRRSVVEASPMRRSTDLNGFEGEYDITSMRRSI